MYYFAVWPTLRFACQSYGCMLLLIFCLQNLLILPLLNIFVR